MGLIFSCTEGVMAQHGGANDNFSPYTMYGVGMLQNGVGVGKKSQGGVGIASSSPFEINYLNPASLGNIRQRSALFSFGVESQNYYSSTKSKDAYGNSITAKNVGNVASINDVGLAIPLARGVGFSVALTPVSSIGYNTLLVGQQPEIIDNIGRVYYSYKGEGGISAVTGSVGVRVAKGLTVGGSLIYYFGIIDRYYTADVSSMVTSDVYKTIKTLESTNISKIGGSFGIQYAFRVSRTGYFTVGGTYQLQTTMNCDKDVFTAAISGGDVDTVRNYRTNQRIVMPQKFGAGIGFSSDKIDVEFNYTYQNWAKSFESDFSNTGVSLTKQIDYRIGLAYTPNRGDIRSALNRWTYKLGGYYGDNYLMKNGVKSNQFSVSIGADVPLKINNPTRLSFGFEYGKMGLNAASSVREDYFKVSLGFTFFGDDMWFEKRKFN